MESSIAVMSGGSTILVDATRDVAAQVRGMSRIDLVLLTHAHRAARGGVRALGRWVAARGACARVWSAAAMLGSLGTRYRRLASFELDAFRGPRSWGGFEIAAQVVPHASDCTT